jgi:hypothetical protein
VEAVAREPTVKGGRVRGLVIHKLMEEVLTGELEDDGVVLSTRADLLIEQLGHVPSADPALGFSGAEIGAAITRTLAIPEIARVRDRLVAEFPVHAAAETGETETAFSGIVDALCIGPDGAPDAVIDWKSDVNPSSDVVEEYRAQVRTYLTMTGIARGLVVFVTTGRVVTVH